MKKPSGRQAKVNKPQKKSTSFRLDPELLRQAQHYAIDHSVTVQGMVEEGLRRVLGLKKESRE
jgi:hypothetical protein